ncbi:MAG: acyl-CoA dehydrogenase family protein [Ferrimicrobium sp.]
MDLAYPPSAERFREEIRELFRSELPEGFGGLGTLDPDEVGPFVEWFREVLFANRLLALSWPTQYQGRGASLIEEIVLAQECARFGVPTGGPNDHFGIEMLGNTLLVHGTEEQRFAFLPKILSGEYRFAQGYSEPDAGSDLANLSLRGIVDGDQVVLNGQKVWTSAAHLANWMFVLCRSDTSLERHRGISFVLVPMDQPGVEVRPIRMISGKTEFNEVFFSEARAASAHIVGGVNNGWPVAMTLLGFERGDAAATLPIRFQGELDRLVVLARERKALDDPSIKDRLVRAHVDVGVLRAMGYRWLTSMLRGDRPGAESSVFKLFWSEYHQRVSELAVDILGSDALIVEGRPASSAFRTDDVGAPNSTRSWDEVYLHARAGTIYAGTSEIQRTIIGERILGLPREPRVL